MAYLITHEHVIDNATEKRGNCTIVNVDQFIRDRMLTIEQRLDGDTSYSDWCREYMDTHRETMTRALDALGQWYAKARQTILKDLHVALMCEPHVYGNPIYCATSPTTRARIKGLGEALDIIDMIEARTTEIAILDKRVTKLTAITETL